MLLTCRFDGAYSPAASFFVARRWWGAKLCPEYCVGMTRLAREGDAPGFACGEVGKAAAGGGAWRLGRVGLPYGSGPFFLEWQLAVAGGEAGSFVPVENQIVCGFGDFPSYIYV